MSDETERTVYLQRIDPDQKEAYLRAHDDVPEGVTDAMERAGVEEFQLFVRDNIAVCILEADDLEAYDEVIATDSAVQSWERRVAEFKLEGVDVDADAGEQVPYMDEVWSFEP